TIAPPPLARIASIAYRVAHIAPRKSVSIDCVQPAIPSAVGCGADALLIRMDSAPNALTADSISRRTCASSRTSARQKIARPPADSMRWTVSRPPGSLVSDTTTAQPSCARRLAIARPQPVPPAPVTMAVMAANYTDRAAMTKTRMEAFSDGVIAILITIMVLDLKVPDGSSLAALRDVAPTFCAYVLSFVVL